ncbi:MAG: SIR2 family protein [Xenococcus sp. MO_188.B8]|nr:SIR2 family protein [Xenococcus sp. MO_188.B8]
MASELSVVIKVSSKNKNFDWDNLRNSWKTTFRGEISEPIVSRGRWTFTWTGADRKLVLEHVEKSLLDREITSHGGSKLIKIMEDQECLYEAMPDVDLSQKTLFRDVGADELKAKAPYVDLLLMTVTDIERKAVLSEMNPWPGQEAILIGSISRNTYRFGQFGRYRAAQVESTMGSDGRAGARATLQDAITELKPKAILLIGIAFGLNRRKQKQHLGDVIIAESVFNYALQRVGEPQLIFRGEETKCGLILSERFRSRRYDWKLHCNRRIVKVHQGLLLSGPKLIANQKFRDQLTKKFQNREPLGGEMEGAGAYEAAEREHVEVILIKGICDWADGHKNDRAQPFAAYAAVSLAKHVLTKPHVLAALRAKDVLYPPPEPDPPLDPPDTRYRLIINALKTGSLVPFLGSGVNPDFYIALASQFAKVVEQELFPDDQLPNEIEKDTTNNQEGFIESLKRQKLIKKIIGIPCSVCPYWLMDRPEECPVRENIETAAYCSLRTEQELAVSKIDLRSFSGYHIRKNSVASLYSKLYDILPKIECKKSQALHQFLATLPHLMLIKGRPKSSPGLPYQLIVTTNYDDMLEQAFIKVQQPFDVVFYVADGEDRGKFKHKPYVGDVRTIDKLDYKLPLCSPWGDAVQPRPIILKLFGTCDKKQKTKFVAIDEQLTLMLDNLARNLPTSLMSILHQNSILFMGYSPRDTDLDRIVHCLWSSPNNMRNKSCLLHQAQPGYLEKEIWKSRNVKLIEIPTSLDDFVTELKEVIDAQIPILEEGIK